MATIRGKCGNCGKDVNIEAAQYVFRGELVWHASYRCPHCGANVEEDGTGAPPDYVRQAILDSEGEWHLLVPETGRRAVLVLKVLRQAKELSMEDVSKLRKLLPGIVLSGTRAEMEWLKSLLEAEGLSASVTSLAQQTSERGPVPE